MNIQNNPMLPLPNPHDWITIDGAAYALGVSDPTVRRMIADGRLTEHRMQHHPRAKGAGPLMVWRPELIELIQARARASVKRDPEA